MKKFNKNCSGVIYHTYYNSHINATAAKIVSSVNATNVINAINTINVKKRGF